MDPFLLGTNEPYTNIAPLGVNLSENLIFDYGSFEAYLDTLDSGTREAVMQCKDEFSSREEVEAFVAHLRG